MDQYSKKTVFHVVSLLVLTVLGAFMLTATSHGALIPKLKSSSFWPGHWPKTVLVTGNFAKPRLLAEIAQRETNLPIILVSPEDNGDELYYMPPPPNARRIQPDKYVELIDVLLRPRRIIFIGDADYLDPSYKEKLKDKYPAISISGDDWIENARELGNLIGVGGLHKKYRQNLIKLLEAEAHSGNISIDEPFSSETDGELTMPEIKAVEE
ncbi:MAG: hypothetical protein R6V56_01570 [Lentisphaeria bacterium]